MKDCDIFVRIRFLFIFIFLFFISFNTVNASDDITAQCDGYDSISNDAKCIEFFSDNNKILVKYYTEFEKVDGGLNRAEIKTWINYMEKAAGYFEELTGNCPFKDFLTIQITNFEKNYWGYIINNDNIYLNLKYFSDESKLMKEMWEDGLINISFGVLHEMSHIFDYKGENENGQSIRQNWNKYGMSEDWADIKLPYILYRFYQDYPNKIFVGGYYTENNIKYAFTGNEYENRIPNNTDYKLVYIDKFYSYKYNLNNSESRIFNYSLAHLNLVKKYGWDIYKNTFCAFQQMDDEIVPETRVAKFYLLLNFLAKYSDIEYDDITQFISNDLIKETEDAYSEYDKKYEKEEIINNEKNLNYSNIVNSFFNENQGICGVPVTDSSNDDENTNTPVDEDNNTSEDEDNNAPGDEDVNVPSVDESGNVTENQQTGDFILFFVLVISFFSICGSVYYFKHVQNF